MSDQTQLIPDENEAVQPQKAKKNDGLKAAVVGGLAVGIGAIGYDAYGSDSSGEAGTLPETGSEKPETTENKVSKDSAQATVPGSSPVVIPDSSQTSTAGESPAVIKPVTDITLIPDHLNVGNAPDEMSFSEAFKLCRDNLGPAAVFEWQGHLYHTCTPEEYDILPDETKNAFAQLYVENEGHTADWVPATEGNMAIVELMPSDYTPGVEVPAHEVPTHETPADSVPAIAHDTIPDEDFDNWFSQTDTAGHSEGIVYSADDFDNDFDGKDEWINPEDLTA
jgi:hypothetical protein